LIIPVDLHCELDQHQSLISCCESHIPHHSNNLIKIRLTLFELSCGQSDTQKDKQTKAKHKTSWVHCRLPLPSPTVKARNVWQVN